MSCRAVWRWEVLESKLRGWKEKKSWVSLSSAFWFCTNAAQLLAASTKWFISRLHHKEPVYVSAWRGLSPWATTGVGNLKCIFLSNYSYIRNCRKTASDHSKTHGDTEIILIVSRAISIQTSRHNINRAVCLRVLGSHGGFQLPSGFLSFTSCLATCIYDYQ